MFDKKTKFNHSLILALLLVGGCSSNFVVKSELPPPLVQNIPIAAKVIYSEEFKNYAYRERDKKRSLQSIDLGKAHVGMFDKVFASLFTLTDDEQQANILIEPSVLDFQYSTPGETSLKVFEIWLKYRLKISGQKGEQIADWVVKGYGKTPTVLLDSATKSFNGAANVALRDIGAQLAVGLPTQPAMKDYLIETGVLAAEPNSIEEEGEYRNKELDNYTESVSIKQTVSIKTNEVEPIEPAEPESENSGAQAIEPSTDQ